jgi:hypothetical protein
VGAHGVGAELGALTGCSKRGRSGGPWWLNDGKHNGTVKAKGRRRKKVLHGGVLPFIGGRGGWKKAV